ncbi:MAG: type I restriction enzyme HsdR N-terminal domain-containing protein [bacterium]|nr:type I restriction enzyme HsdR N-terminal domain-containing protein [bacterium]
MFRAEIMEHASRVSNLIQAYPEIKNSEAQTKNSLIEPFLRCLGYDPSHPEQVTLEVSTELGGKIDYVLSGQADVKVAVEAKKAGVKLSEKETNQLRSYFTFSEAAAALLTNGVEYWLFTDLEKTNVMDATPFHRVDVTHLTDNDMHHLETLTRSQVQQDGVHQQAQRERYRRMVNEIVTQELHSPSQDFLKLVGRRVGIKPLTKSHLELLAPLVNEAIRRYRGVTSPPKPKPPSSTQTPKKPVSPTTYSSQPTTAPTRGGSGKTTHLTLSRYRGATLFGKALPGNSYRQMLIAVVAALQARHPHDFPDRVRNEKAFRGRQWWYISKDASDLSPKLDRAKVGEYHVNVNFGRLESVKQAHRFLIAFGYSADELEVQTSDD